MKNIVENQDIKTDKPLAMSYEALKAERDALADRVNALAVENAALKGVVGEINEELYGKGLEVYGWHLNGDLEPLDNWFTDNGWGTPETPATDAALAAIQAQGVERFADFLGKLYQCEKANTAKGKAYKHVIFLACQFVNEMREAK